MLKAEYMRTPLHRRSEETMRQLPKSCGKPVRDRRLDVNSTRLTGRRASFMSFEIVPLVRYGKSGPSLLPPKELYPSSLDFIAPHR